MIEVNYENLVADLEAESRRLIEFLGLDWEPGCLDFHRTERMLERALSLCPDSVDSHVQLAKLLRLEGRNPEAIAALKKAIDIQPESAAAYNDLGLICLAEMDVAQAVDCFSRAIEINPDLAIAHHNRGLALEQESPAEAIASFRQAARIDPNFAEATPNWAICC